MKTNVAVQKAPIFTHEGARAAHTDLLSQLRRSVLACLLWEDTFYEGGVAISERITALVKQLPFAPVAALAVEARQKFHMRHVPLFLTALLLKARKGSGREVGDLIYRVIQRADEPAELLSLYWKDQPNAPLTKQLKVGLARAIKKFDEYQLAKYNRDAAIRLRDVLFLVHAKPADEALFKRLADDELEVPETWEVMLSSGGNKKAVFEHLMLEGNLGGLAFLRNLRNMNEAGVDEGLMRLHAENVNVNRILPFRYLSAAKVAPRMEDMLEAMMYRSIAQMEKLPGKTAILIDHSGSMEHMLSAKSTINRFEAAAMLAVLVRELATQCRVFTFSDRCIEVPPRRGFAMVDAVKSVINPVGTMLGSAVRHVYQQFPECERIIVITDEQSADRPPKPQGHGYIVNVAAYQNGVGHSDWVTISGFSEAIIDYIRATEAEPS